MFADVDSTSGIHDNNDGRELDGSFPTAVLWWLQAMYSSLKLAPLREYAQSYFSLCSELDTLKRSDPTVLSQAKQHKAQPPMLQSTGNRSGRCEGTVTIISSAWRPSIATNDSRQRNCHPLATQESVVVSGGGGRKCITAVPKMKRVQT